MELLHQQRYQQQQREMAARYHMAAMGNPVLSTGVEPHGYSMAGVNQHMHPKAKSNDLMFMNSLYNP